MEKSSKKIIAKYNSEVCQKVQKRSSIEYAAAMQTKNASMQQLEVRLFRKPSCVNW